MTAFPRPNRDASQMQWVRAPISGAKWQVHRELAPILAHIVSTAEQRGYLFDYGPADVDDDWGYYVRKISGSGTWSYHSAGAAVDIDAQNYPQGQRRKVPPGWLIALFRQWGWNWGGEFRNPDPMHFEFRGTVNEARRFVAALGLSVTAPTPIPVPVPVGTPSPQPQPAKIPNHLGGDTDMILRNQDDGAIWAVSATHMHHLTGPEWAQRSSVENVVPFPVPALFIMSLAAAGRAVV